MRGHTEKIFTTPQQQETEDYATGRFDWHVRSSVWHAIRRTHLDSRQFSLTLTPIRSALHGLNSNHMRKRQ